MDTPTQVEGAKAPTTTFPELLDTAETCAVTRHSRITLWRHVRERTFPPPVKINNRNFFVAEEVRAWLEERLAARNAA